jgi:hypothetical protein
VFTNIRKNWIHILPKYGISEYLVTYWLSRMWQDGRGTPPLNDKHERKATAGQPPGENHDDNHPR